MRNKQTNSHLEGFSSLHGAAGEENGFTMTIQPAGLSHVFLGTYRRAFTMIELIMIVAILALLAVMIIPRISWIEPPKRVLQRAFIEAVDMARNGASIRFRVDIENEGVIVPEILTKDKEKMESTWKTFGMRWKPEGKGWAFSPELIYFFQDGTCTPARITWGTIPYVDKYLLTVTGYLIENK